MRTVTTITILLASVISAAGQHFWFEPDKFFVKPGQSVLVSVNSGFALSKETEEVYQSSRTTAFQMISSSGKFDLRTMADDEKSPILNFSTDREGTYLLVLEQNSSLSTIESRGFENHIRSIGMEYIQAERAKLDESTKPTRLRTTRFLKTLLQVGQSQTGTAKTRSGSKIEIVPLDNPYSKKVGDFVNFQIWFDGRPLADKLVFANNRAGKDVSTFQYQSDQTGKFKIKLDRNGIWLIRTDYLARCQRNCGEADWESFSGFLTFGLR